MNTLAVGNRHSDVVTIREVCFSHTLIHVWCFQRETNMDFDLFLTKYVGEFGRYQRFLVFLFCVEEIFMAINTLSGIFIAGKPNHFCYTGLTASANCSLERIKNFSLPTVIRDGETRFSTCSMFDRNYYNLTINDVCPSESYSLPASLDTNVTATRSCVSWVYDELVFPRTVVTEVGYLFELYFVLYITAENGIG